MSPSSRFRFWKKLLSVQRLIIIMTLLWLWSATYSILLDFELVFEFLQLFGQFFRQAKLLDPPSSATLGPYICTRIIAPRTHLPRSRGLQYSYACRQWFVWLFGVTRAWKVRTIVGWKNIKKSAIDQIILRNNNINHCNIGTYEMEDCGTVVTSAGT